MQKIFQRGRGLGHVTTKIFGIRSTLSSRLLELETSNLVRSFLLEKPSRRSNNFPQKGRGLGHVTPKIFGIQLNLSGIRLNISSKLLQLGTSKLVHSFIFGKPSGRGKKFYGKGACRSHVTLKIYGIQ